MSIQLRPRHLASPAVSAREIYGFIVLCLGLQTATLAPGVGLAEDGRIIWERADAAPPSKAQAIFTYLAEARAEGSLDLDKIGLIAVTVGPGSFTGLKVGLAAAKTLAFALDIPTVGVSSLAALAASAASAHPQAVIAPLLDARRQMVYTALFKAQAGGLTRLAPDEAIAPDELADRLLARPDDGPVILVGDGLKTYGPLLTERLGSRIVSAAPELWPISAGQVARLGLELAEAGQAVAPDRLEGRYLRPADAVLPKKPLVSL